MCCARNISRKIVKANKDHHDDSAEWLESILHERLWSSEWQLSFSEWRSIAKLKANGWKIKKGQLYERQYNVQDGETFTFKTLPEIAKICQKLDLYCTC
jgi:hypothetical protein